MGGSLHTHSGQIHQFFNQPGVLGNELRGGQTMLIHALTHSGQRVQCLQFLARQGAVVAGQIIQTVHAGAHGADHTIQGTARLGQQSLIAGDAGAALDLHQMDHVTGTGGDFDQRRRAAHVDGFLPVGPRCQRSVAHHAKQRQTDQQKQTLAQGQTVGHDGVFFSF